MNYFKGILSGLSAIIIAQLMSWHWPLFNGSKATGIAAIEGLFVETLFSPLFWMLAIVLFAIFFVASRFRSKPLRVVFFWIPTLTTSGLVLAIASLLAYAVIQLKSS